MVKSCIICGRIHAPGTNHVFDKLDQMAEIFPQVRNQKAVEVIEDAFQRVEERRKPGRPRKHG